MTWRWPSTAETCRHFQPNKYDTKTVVFWQPPPFCIRRVKTERPHCRTQLHWFLFNIIHYKFRPFGYRQVYHVTKPLWRTFNYRAISKRKTILKWQTVLRLTHHVLLCARLHVSVYIDHHQALFWINSKHAGLYIGIPTMFAVCTSVYICHTNTLKSKDKMVTGK